MKAKLASQARKLVEIPNVGARMAMDFQKMGIKKPDDLKGKNAYALYKKICAITKTRHDPCVLDTYMAVIDFMNGAAPRPWWTYTPDRRRLYPKI